MNGAYDGVRMEIECRTTADLTIPDVFDVYKTTAAPTDGPTEVPIETTEAPYDTTTNPTGSLKIEVLFTLCVNCSCGTNKTTPASEQLKLLHRTCVGLHHLVSNQTNEERQPCLVTTGSRQIGFLPLIRLDFFKDFMYSKINQYERESFR